MGYFNISFSVVFLALASVVGTFSLTTSSSHQDLSLSVQSLQPEGCCVPQHFSALLRLKRGFQFPYYSSVTNLSSWNPENRDCCTWEGITCDSTSGHVVGLDLRELQISGHVDFQTLSHLGGSLRILNLAYNDFDPSPISPAIGQLHQLTHLNLSQANFHGQITVEMSSLTRLVSLDLSCGDFTQYICYHRLKLEKPSFGTLIQNMSSLRELALTSVNLSSDQEWSRTISSSLPNLRKLSMADCDLSGPIHPSFSHLPRLSQLDLRYSRLDGKHLGCILRLPCLTKLDLSYNDFSSVEPSFARNVSSFKLLTELRLQWCSMIGRLPPHLANFTRLEILDLSYNFFSGSIPFSYGTDLLNVREISLHGNWLSGIIPSSLFSLPSLTRLNLKQNQLNGRLDELRNASFSPLCSVDLSENMLHGSIPRSIFQLMNLKHLFLYINDFTDTLHLDLFLNLTKLQRLTLSDVNLLVEDGTSDLTSVSLPQFSILTLHSCNITRFPNFLRNQQILRYLDLSGNKMEGKIPLWIWKLGNGNMVSLNLSHNALQAIQMPTPSLSLGSLETLDLSSNVLEGLLPIPSSSLQFFSVSSNSLSGEISVSICNLTSLNILDLSHNNFSGPIPPCFSQMSNVLTVLNLRRNVFRGRLFQTIGQGCSLEMLDLSENQFEGELPSSLVNCGGLRVINVGNNHMCGTFPSWTQRLDNLWIFILRSNYFYGPIELPPSTQNSYSRLQIIDLSNNRFNGSLSSTIFFGWKGMIEEGDSTLEYVMSNTPNHVYLASDFSLYYESIMVRSKSLELDFQRIPTVFTLLDLSSNYFQGRIPESIGILKSLMVLNMSRNGFTGRIPTSMKNLKALESLDLSQNSISGYIPQELLKLTFLEVFNVSKNQLSGPIPYAEQFLTFTNESFQGNSGLCGPPLAKACKETDGASPSMAFENPEFQSESEYDWEIIAVGFGIGYGVGIGAFYLTLVLWRKGRRAYNKFVYKLLLIIVPSAVQ